MTRTSIKNYIYSFLLSIFPSFSFYLNSLDQLIFFSVTLFLFIILGLDSRFFIILGIINLILSASFFSTSLGNVAYFYLLFGVIGIILQEPLGIKISNKVQEKLRKRSAIKYKTRGRNKKKKR